MRRTSTFAAAVLALVLVVSACGDDDNDGGSTTSTTAGMGNPASAYCEKQGGTVENEKDDQGNETGICVLPDGTRVDEWQYYRDRNQK